MQRAEVVEQLKNYIVLQVLDGKNIGLDETTPLLEWGVINSLEIMRLLSFIQRQFHVDISSDQMVATNFVNISAIAEMVFANKQEVSME
jgi:acyl carrier protein